MERSIQEQYLYYLKTLLKISKCKAFKEKTSLIKADCPEQFLDEMVSQLLDGQIEAQRYALMLNKPVEAQNEAIIAHGNALRRQILDLHYGIYYLRELFGFADEVVQLRQMAEDIYQLVDYCPTMKVCLELNLYEHPSSISYLTDQGQGTTIALTNLLKTRKEKFYASYLSYAEMLCFYTKIAAEWLTSATMFDFTRVKHSNLLRYVRADGYTLASDNEAVTDETKESMAFLDTRDLFKVLELMRAPADIQELLRDQPQEELNKESEEPDMSVLKAYFNKEKAEFENLLTARKNLQDFLASRHEEAMLCGALKVAWQTVLSQCQEIQQKQRAISKMKQDNDRLLAEVKAKSQRKLFS